MARPAERRHPRILLAALLLAHLLVISRQVDAGGGVSLLESSVLFVVLPVQSAVHRVGDAVAGAWSGYVDLRGARAEKWALEERVRGLETQLQERSQRAREAEALRDLLGLRALLPVETLAAEVTGRDGTPWFRTLTLNKGSDDGVHLNAAVLGSSGVVGRVIRRGPRACLVQLLLDQESGAGVRIERSRVTGVVAGQVGLTERPSRDLVLRYVPAMADVVPGDVVVTSGLDRIFPPGLLVGRVRSVSRGSGLFSDIRVTPSADFDRLEIVLVATTTWPPEDFPESVR
jgi:rod shape-determining protein MreC